MDIVSCVDIVKAFASKRDKTFGLDVLAVEFTGKNLDAVLKVAQQPKGVGTPHFVISPDGQVSRLVNPEDRAKFVLTQSGHPNLCPTYSTSALVQERKDLSFNNYSMSIVYTEVNSVLTEAQKAATKELLEDLADEGYLFEYVLSAHEVAPKYYKAKNEDYWTDLQLDEAVVMGELRELVESIYLISAADGSDKTTKKDFKSEGAVALADGDEPQGDVEGGSSSFREDSEYPDAESGDEYLEGSGGVSVGDSESLSNEAFDWSGIASGTEREASSGENTLSGGVILSDAEKLALGVLSVEGQEADTEFEQEGEQEEEQGQEDELITEVRHRALLEGMHFQGGKLLHAIIRDCDLLDVSIEDCEIEDSRADKCVFASCKFINSEIKTSQISESKLSSSIVTGFSKVSLSELLEVHMDCGELSRSKGEKLTASKVLIEDGTYDAVCFDEAVLVGVTCTGGTVKSTISQGPVTLINIEVLKPSTGDSDSDALDVGPDKVEFVVEPVIEGSDVDLEGSNGVDKAVSDVKVEIEAVEEKDSKVILKPPAKRPGRPKKAVITDVSVVAAESEVVKEKGNDVEVVASKVEETSKRRKASTRLSKESEDASVLGDEVSGDVANQKAGRGVKGKAVEESSSAVGEVKSEQGQVEKPKTRNKWKKWPATKTSKGTKK